MNNILKAQFALLVAGIEATTENTNNIAKINDALDFYGKAHPSEVLDLTTNPFPDDVKFGIGLSKFATDTKIQKCVGKVAEAKQKIADLEAKNETTQHARGALTRSLTKLKETIGLEYGLSKDQFEWAAAWCLKNIKVVKKSVAEIQEKTEKTEK